jgi:hypothetical protein
LDVEAISGSGALSGDGALSGGGAVLDASAVLSSGALAGVEEEERVRRDLRALHTRLHGLRLILALTQRDADADVLLPVILSSYSASLGADLAALSAELGLPVQPPLPSVPPDTVQALMPACSYAAVRAAPHAHFPGDCSVCMCELEPESVVRVLPCRHVFHAACIDPWFCRADVCPNCRQKAAAVAGPALKAATGSDTELDWAV